MALEIKNYSIMGELLGWHGTAEEVASCNQNIDRHWVYFHMTPLGVKIGRTNDLIGRYRTLKKTHNVTNAMLALAFPHSSLCIRKELYFHHKYQHLWLPDAKGKEVFGLCYDDVLTEAVKAANRNDEFLVSRSFVDIYEGGVDLFKPEDFFRHHFPRSSIAKSTFLVRE